MSYRTGKSRSGMAVALTLLGLFVVLSIILIGAFSSGAPTGSGIVTMTSNSTQMATVNLNSTEAFNLAESGVEYTLEWLHMQSSPPTNSSAFAPSLWNSTSVGNPARSVVSYSYTDANTNTFTGTFSVEIYPNSSNAGSTQKKYLIESVGTYNGTSQLVSAYVEQSSFGKYAYFTDMDNSQGYWTCGVDQFDGPMHSNNANSSDVPGTVPTNIIWYNAANSAPMFTYTGNDAFTCVSSSVAWQLNQINNFVAPQSSSDWSDVSTGGANSVQTGTAVVPLPTTTTSESTAALGAATAPSGSVPSVIIPNTTGSTNGGIYIHGNVDEMTLTTTNSTTQNIEIDQTNTTTNPSTSIKTYVTINPATNQTTLYTVTKQGSGSAVTSPTSTYTGLTNGVVYSDGNIGDGSDGTNSLNNYYHGGSMTGGLHGTIADNYYNTSGTLVHASALTIATSLSSNLSLDGSLTTNTQRLKNSNGSYVPEYNDPTFLKNGGTLGLVSHNVEVIDKDSSGHSLTNVEIDGSVIATGTFDATDIANRPIGTFQVMGGYIAGECGYFGAIDNSGNLIDGFHEHYNYDARMADNPPPFFPTTGTSYDITSWTRQGYTSTLQ